MYEGKIIFQGQDEYTFLDVVQAGNLRTLHFGSPVAQSSMFVNDPFKVEMEYNQVMLLSLIYNINPSRVLFLGLGGGAKSKFLWKHFSCTIHAVEWSPLVIKAGHAYFEIPQDSRFQIYELDALQFLRREQIEFYDFIFVDLYDDEGISPVVISSDFFQLCREKLSPQGVLVWNLWRKTKKDWLEAGVQNLSRTFAQHYKILTVEESLNLIIYAFVNSNLPKDTLDLTANAKILTHRTGLDFLSLLSKQSSLKF